MAQLDNFFKLMVQQGASDLHISTGVVPMLRLHGDMLPIKFRELTAQDTKALLYEIMAEKYRKQFEELKDTDFAYELPGIARFRANVFMDRKGMGGVFRQIPVKIMTAEDLGLSPAIHNLCKLHKGLVLVTGPTGSGKSTTLCAMIDLINRTRKVHIITIEDPIEFVHPNKMALINQREVGIHTMSFKNALRAALREDPDIVLVGEMRDLETVAIAIETAETGHLVFGTLHTTTAASTVDRIIEQFPEGQQAQIRTMLGGALKGVVAQNLLKLKSGKGRCAALELLIVNPAISNLIREGKTFQIPSMMQAGKKYGMQLLPDVLMDLVISGKVTPEEAFSKAADKAGFKKKLNKQGYKIKLEGAEAVLYQD